MHLGRAALLIALHNLLWTMAVLETSIGHAIAIAALAPLWSVLIEWRMFGDRVSMCTVFSVVLTSSAIALLFLNDPGGPIPGGQGMVVSASHTLRASDRPAVPRAIARVSKQARPPNPALACLRCEARL